MVEVRQTATFRNWLTGLADARARDRITVRIQRVQSGLLGSVRALGEGVSELKIDHGPGYRVYFVQRGEVLVILLCGGDKRTQDRDIRTAKAMAADLED